MEEKKLCEDGKSYTRDEYILAIKNKLVKLLLDGEACYHPSCLTEENCPVCNRKFGVRTV